MTDAVVEKLVQNVCNLMEENRDLNIVVRRLEPTRETLNNINERNDAIATAIGQIEKGLKLDDNRLKELEEQTKSLEQTLASFGNSISLLAQKADTIRVDVINLSPQINDLEEKLAAAYNKQFQWLIIWGLTHRCSLLSRIPLRN